MASFEHQLQYSLTSADPRPAQYGGWEYLKSWISWTPLRGDPSEFFKTLTEWHTNLSDIHDEYLKERKAVLLKGKKRGCLDALGEVLARHAPLIEQVDKLWVGKSPQERFDQWGVKLSWDTCLKIRDAGIAHMRLQKVEAEIQVPIPFGVLGQCLKGRARNKQALRTWTSAVSVWLSRGGQNSNALLRQTLVDFAGAQQNRLWSVLSVHRRKSKRVSLLATSALARKVKKTGALSATAVKKASKLGLVGKKLIPHKQGVRLWKSRLKPEESVVAVVARLVRAGSQPAGFNPHRDIERSAKGGIRLKARSSDTVPLDPVLLERFLWETAQETAEKGDWQEIHRLWMKQSKLCCHPLARKARTEFVARGTRQLRHQVNLAVRSIKRDYNVGSLSLQGTVAQQVPSCLEEDACAVVLVPRDFSKLLTERVVRLCDLAPASPTKTL